MTSAGTSTERTRKVSSRIPTAIAKAITANGVIGMIASIAKLSASATPATVIVRPARGAAAATASCSGRRSASFQTRPTTKML